MHAASDVTEKFLDNFFVAIRLTGRAAHKRKRRIVVVGNRRAFAQKFRNHHQIAVREPRRWRHVRVQQWANDGFRRARRDRAAHQHDVAIHVGAHGATDEFDRRAKRREIHRAVGARGRADTNDGGICFEDRFAAVGRRSNALLPMAFCDKFVEAGFDDSGAAARVGVRVHAVAGDAAARGGQRGLIASDVINELRRWVNP